MLLTLLPDHVDATLKTATPCQILIVEVLVEGHNGGMGIVGVQNDELFLLLGHSL